MTRSRGIATGQINKEKGANQFVEMSQGAGTAAGEAAILDRPR